jgi:hypothetical protein
MFILGRSPEDTDGGNFDYMNHENASLSQNKANS